VADDLPMKIVTVIALSIAAALAVPSLASATTYCVGDPEGACDASTPATAAGLQQVLTDVENTGGVADVVKIGPGTYTGKFTYSSSAKAIEVKGSGAATVIQGLGGEPALQVSASSGSVVSNLEVRMAAMVSPACTVGLRIGSAVAEGVRVENPSGSCGAGVELEPGGDLFDSTILAGAAVGIQQQGGPGAHTVSDSRITGTHAVLAPDGTWTFRRLRITGRSTGIQAGGVVSLENSLIRLLGEPGFTSRALQQLGPGEFVADHVTIVGGADATFGVQAAMTGVGSSTLSLTNSILSGTFSASSFTRFAAAGGTANIVVGHSNFAPPAPPLVDASAGPGAFQETAGTNTHVDPRFVDASESPESPGLDFHLRYDSPLIDRGKPDGLQAKDLAGEPRLVNGDGVDDPRRDMGAYEYQRLSPTAVIAVPGPDAIPAGVPVAFSAAGSGDPDPGDPLEYTWSFGDGSTATGQAPSHTFQSGGARTVTLTVTDPTGLSATAAKELLVSQLPGDARGTGTEADRDETAPVISSVSLRAKRLRFRLSEAAKVRFSIQRRSGGRRVASFVRRASAGRNSMRFTGRLRVGGRTRSLAPGRYRLLLVATDPAGNRSAVRRLPFRVPRR
jgi:hypothetical protein